MSTTVTLVEELHREYTLPLPLLLFPICPTDQFFCFSAPGFDARFAGDSASISIRHLDAYASSARMNARLDEATAETHEAWRVAAHAMLHHTLSTHKHVLAGTAKDVPLFVRVPPLYGLRGAGAYAVGTDTTDSTDSTDYTYAVARTANAPGGMGMGMGVGVGVGGSGTRTRTIRAGSVGYSISARPLYHTHATPISTSIPIPIPSPISLPLPLPLAIPIPIPVPARKATLVATATAIMPSMPSILAVLAGAAAVPLEADLDVAAF
ncbi:hypothetical protein CCMSSC00406_0003389 [Pleurotus cornucopiae]|uniref:Uncharacterized protein n=1 Tax=Pleurotus cornucopiae TaxID=5321 RepID=A0ACB7JAM2_PLECO|nr:hypothetical protein CCMSSC00406_0003389 [Pleurotus cornucopiae]